MANEDLWFDETGDLAVAPNGDLATTDSPWRDDVQAAYLRTMTDIGDFTLYPLMGAGLSQLYGQPQSPETGQLAVQFVTSALNREQRFNGRTFSIVPVPVSFQQLKLTISITSGSRQQILLTVVQNLGVH